MNRDCVQNPVFSYDHRDFVFRLNGCHLALSYMLCIVLALSPGCVQHDKARWRPVNRSVRSLQIQGKIGDCKQSYICFDN